MRIYALLENFCPRPEHPETARETGPTLRVRNGDSVAGDHFPFPFRLGSISSSSSSFSSNFSPGCRTFLWDVAHSDSDAIARYRTPLVLTLSGGRYSTTAGPGLVKT